MSQIKTFQNELEHEALTTRKILAVIPLTTAYSAQKTQLRHMLTYCAIRCAEGEMW